MGKFLELLSRKITAVYRWIGWKWCIAILLLILIFGTYAYRVWQIERRTPKINKTTLAEAGRTGTKVTHELLVKIENSKCPVEATKSCIQRGDVVQASEGERPWSIAEKEGFLIIKVELTPAEAALIVRPREKVSGGIFSEPKLEQEARRNFAVDLEKIGVSPDDQKGRVISDKIFMSDILVEKE